eukprot:scaffold2931_cov154-Isochrysis_galbana.AAC.4
MYLCHDHDVPVPEYLRGSGLAGREPPLFGQTGESAESSLARRARSASACACVTCHKLEA